MKKWSTLLGLVAAAATLTVGSAQATPATVAIKDLRLVSETSTDRPSEFNHGGYYGGRGGYYGGRGGYYGGRGGYYGGRGGYYGGRGGYYGGRGGYYGGRWLAPTEATPAPKVSL